MNNPPKRSDPLPIRVGVLGSGNVGAPLAELIAARRQAILERTGVDLAVTVVAVRDLAKPRPRLASEIRLTDEALSVVESDQVDVIVELIGGIEPARNLVLEALRRGKPVVTGNKALLANHGAELFAAADAAGVDLLFEAAVAGGIPLIRPLRESLLGEDVIRVMGIVNGTTNYILTKMAEEGASYAEALVQAQNLGYAEADPSADVGGHDAAAKASILATIAFGQSIVDADVHREGIESVTGDDIAYAARHGLVIKLLGIAEGHGEGIAVRVHPTLLPETHPLASVRGSFNAVFVEGRSVGQLMFYGRGAGGDPTASAVLGDVIDAAVNLRKGTHASLGTFPKGRITPIDDVHSAFYVSIDVEDRPGVLAAVAGAFGHHSVSIRVMEQQGIGQGARIVFVTHPAPERAVRQCLQTIEELDVVQRVGSVLRVLEGA